MEGHFEASAPADLYLLGWVDKESQTTTGLRVPGGLGFMLEQDFDAPVTGLNAFPEEDRPGQVNAVFQFYHLMVAIGMTLIGLSLLAGFFWYRGTLFRQRWLLWTRPLRRKRHRRPPATGKYGPGRRRRYLTLVRRAE